MADEAAVEQEAEVESQPEAGTPAAESAADESYEGLADTLAESLNADLPALLGVGVQVKAGPARRVGVDDLDCEGAAIDQPLRLGAEVERGVHLVCSVGDAVVLGALQAGADAEGVKAAREAGSLGDHAEGFSEVMRLLTALLEKAAQDVGMEHFEVQPLREMEEPRSAENWTGPGHFLCRRLQLAVEGMEAVALLLLVETEGGEGATEEQAPPPAPLLIFDADPEARDRLEELGEAEGREVTAIDPSDFGDETWESLTEVRGIVIAWDLGGRSGLELLERLVRDERSHGLPIAMAHPAPTREMVGVALRQGARGFLIQPYELAEVDQTLLAG